MSLFAQLLETHSEKLEQRWAHGPGATSTRLRERLPQLLRSLIATLRQGATPESDTPAIQFGFDVQGVVREYGALASLLLDAADEAGVNLSPADVRTFTAFMASAVAQAVAVHGALQSESQRTSELHLQHLQLARESHEVRRREERLKRLLEATGAGGWEFNVATQTVEADAGLLELHNVTPGPAISVEVLMAAVHPDDRDIVRAAIDAALDPRGTRRYFVQYRVLGKGSFRWLEANGRVIFDTADAPSRVVGTALDITQRKEAELAREGLIEALQAQSLMSMTVLEGPQLIVKMVNEGSRKDVGAGRETIGKPAFDAFPHLARKFEDLLKGVVQSGKPAMGREVHRPLDRGDGVLEDRYIDFVLQPLRGKLGTIDGVISLSIDVTRSVERARAAEGDALALLKVSLERLHQSQQGEQLKNTLEAMRRLIDARLNSNA